MNIADLTLYGRIAYGVRCCLALCKNKKANIGKLGFVLNKLCDYTLSHDLAEWERVIVPLMPECIFEAIDNNGKPICRVERCSEYNMNDLKIFCIHAKTCQFVKQTERTNQEQDTYKLYLDTDDELLYIIQVICDIGRSELYGATSRGEESKMLLLRILTILEKNNVDIPPITEFHFQTFNDRFCFGTEFDCTYIIKEFVS